LGQFGQPSYNKTEKRVFSAKFSQKFSAKFSQKFCENVCNQKSTTAAFLTKYAKSLCVRILEKNWLISKEIKKCSVGVAADQKMVLRYFFKNQISECQNFDRQLFEF
jgi:hypothetical protein